MIGTLIAQIHDEARRVWCFKTLALWVAALLILAGAPIVMTLPKVYEAWAQIYVAKETPLGSAAQGVSLVGQGYGDPYVVEKTLLNDDSLEKLLHRLNPATRTLTQGQTALAIRALKSKIRVSPSVDDGFFELHVVDTDPVRARDITQWLIEEFLSRNLSRSQDALGDATRFLDAQMVTYRQMLEDSNLRMQSFRAQHPGLATADTAVMIGPPVGGQVTTASVAAPRRCWRGRTSGSPGWTQSWRRCAANIPMSIRTSSPRGGSRPSLWPSARSSPCEPHRRRPTPRPSASLPARRPASSEPPRRRRPRSGRLGPTFSART
jgi:hypothetical protein